MTLIIFGLVMDILGAWLIGYEVIFKQPKMLRIRIARERIVGLESSLKQMKRIWRLPTPPYTSEEVDEYQSELDTEYSRKIEEQNSIIEESNLSHDENSFKYALIGLIFLTIGFAMQIIGVVNANA